MTNQRKDLQEVLRSRAERAVLTPAGLGEVQRRARGIRRRRTTLAVAGAAASVAVVVGLGVVLAPGGDDRTTPAEPTRSSALPQAPTPRSPKVSSMVKPPTGTRSSGAGTSGAPTYTVDLDAVQEGNGPALTIPNWSKGMLVDGHGGHPVQVRDRVQQAVLDPSGRWQGLVQGADLRWNTYAADGSVTAWDQAFGRKVAITPDGGTYALLLSDGGIGVRLSVRGRQQWETAIGRGDGTQITGILPDGNVVITQPDMRTVVVHPDGSQHVVPGGTNSTTASAVTGKIVIDVGDQRVGSCWGLTDETGAKGPRTCAYLPELFNADGTQLAAVDADALGWIAGTDRVHLLDAATLRPVASFTAAKNTTLDIADAAWMGDQLVVPVHGPARGTDSWGLALLSTDGVRIIAQATTPATSDQSPYLFGAGPLATQ